MYWLVIYLMLSGQPYEFVYPEPFAEIQECAAVMDTIQQGSWDRRVLDAGCRSDDSVRATAQTLTTPTGERQ